MIKRVLEHYNIPGEIVDVEINESGNINRTLIVTFEEAGVRRKYLIQRINTTVFPDPYTLMKNVMGVTDFIKNGDCKHRTLEIIKTKTGSALCHVSEEDSFWRIYEYIENAIAYDYSTELEIVYNTGKAFGNFQRMLASYPMGNLEETIKDFHNTPKRLEKLKGDLKTALPKRVIEVAREIDFILQREDECSEITSKLGTPEVPLRVTHNDTKVNNVLMNATTGDFLAVIDLDTVMPGSGLYDYGDGVRSAASNAKEDETDLSKVFLDLNLFQQFTDGFMSEMAIELTSTEVSLMADSIKIIALELGIRFLNDYINGDVYFKTNYPTHNLDRARNQLHLAYDIETKIDYLRDYINKSYSRHKGELQLKRDKIDN